MCSVTFLATPHVNPAVVDIRDVPRHLAAGATPWRSRRFHRNHLRGPWPPRRCHTRLMTAAQPPGSPSASMLGDPFVWSTSASVAYEVALEVLGEMVAITAAEIWAEEHADTQTPTGCGARSRRRHATPPSDARCGSATTTRSPG